LDEALGLKSGLNWKLAVVTAGDPGNMSRPSEMEELGLGVASVAACRPFRSASTFFLTRPRRFSNLEVSMEVARRRALLPGLASGLIIHQDDLPVPSFCTRMKRLWRERLWRIEFCNTKDKHSLSSLSLYFMTFSQLHILHSVELEIMNWKGLERKLLWPILLGGTSRMLSEC
jgi:hypothetical protein